MKVTSAWIKERCIDDAGCLIWQNQVNRYGAPIAKTSAPGGKRPTIYVRRAMWELRNGPIPEGQYVTYGCTNTRCLSCLVLATFSDVNRRTWQRADVYARRVAANARSGQKRAKLDMEKARYIRESSKTLTEIAEELGISAQLASVVRRGIAWKDASNPFAALMVAA